MNARNHRDDEHQVSNHVVRAERALRLGAEARAWRPAAVSDAPNDQARCMRPSITITAANCRPAVSGAARRAARRSRSPRRARRIATGHVRRPCPPPASATPGPPPASITPAQMSARPTTIPATIPTTCTGTSVPLGHCQCLPVRRSFAPSATWTGTYSYVVQFERTTIPGGGYRRTQMARRVKSRPKRSSKRIPVRAAVRGSELCLQCGLCCDGTLFTSGPVEGTVSRSSWSRWGWWSRSNRDGEA